MTNEAVKREWGSGSGTYAARGSVLDGLAALQNFEYLLRSPRVGPRSLGRIVDELRSSCSPIRVAFELMVTEISQREENARLLGELAREVETHMSRLDETLLKAGRADMGARARIALETEVHKVGVALAAQWRLLDVLDHATQSRHAELDAMDVARAAVQQLSQAHGVPSVDVALIAPASPATLFTDPRVAMPLIGYAIGVVALQGTSTIGVQVSTRNGSALVKVSPCRPVAGATLCVVPRVDGLVVEAASMAAWRVGGFFEPDDKHCSVALPLAHAPSLPEQEPALAANAL